MLYPNQVQKKRLTNETKNKIKLSCMMGKNRRLVTDAPVEVGDGMKITGHFRGIYRIYLKIDEEKPEDVNM